MTIDLGRYIDRCAAEALLDNNQKRLAELLEVAELTVGKKCPDCGSENVECGGDDWLCGDCGEIFRLGTAAVRALQDLGYNVVLEGEY